MAHTEKTGVEAESWKPVEGFPGWFVLMDFAADNKKPRLIVSAQDEYFLLEVARAHYPKDELRVVVDGNRKILARKPQA